jgi:hypothetical protein
MSFSNLSKQHKQYLLLGTIVAAALAILIVFGVKVSLSSITEAKQALQELTSKIEAADRSVTRTELNQDEFRETISKLKACLHTIPPDRNYYSWATEVIYDEARSVFFEIDAIDEVVLPGTAGVNAEQDRVEMETYSLRITAHGGYEHVKRFLNRIAENHPLVRVTGVEISSGSQAEVHDVQLFIEWPFNMGNISDSWGSISEKQAEPSKPLDPDAKQMPTPPPPRLGDGSNSDEGSPTPPTGQGKPVA